MTAAPSTAGAEAALRERGLLPLPGRTMPEGAPGRPWFVSTLLGASGWLAGIFCLAFLAAFLRHDRPGQFLATGLVLLGVAWGLYRTAAGAFVEQLALAVSLAGHLGVAVATAMWSRSETGTAAAVAACQAAWAIVAPNRTARLFAAAFGSAAWALAVRFATTGERTGWSPNPTTVDLGSALAAWAAAWGPIAAAVVVLVRTEVRWLSLGHQRLLRPVLTGLLLALAFATVASHPLEGLAFWSPDGPPRTNWLALWPLLSAGAALLALGCAHRLRSRPLMGAAVAGALLHVFHFYLLVGTTLLTKAAILTVVGALLLGAAVLLDRRRDA